MTDNNDEPGNAGECIGVIFGWVIVIGFWIVFLGIAIRGVKFVAGM